MNPRAAFPDWKAVGAHYDRKGKDDLNWQSAVDKRIVHHHSGIFNDPEEVLGRKYAENELLATLGESENRLTELGASALAMRDKRGLDCGCGRGGSSFMLALGWGHRMFGITVSDSQLAFARENAVALELSDRTRFEKLNVYSDPIPGRFDFIWACESTEYMPDKDLLFGKWYDLLEAGGKAVVFAITYRRSRHASVRNELEKLDALYETKIGEFDSYLSAASRCGFVIDDIVGLEEAIVPYYRLRLRTPLMRGSEDWLIKGLEDGSFKYSMFLYTKI